MDAKEDAIMKKIASAGIVFVTDVEMGKGTPVVAKSFEVLRKACVAWVKHAKKRHQARLRRKP